METQVRPALRGTFFAYALVAGAFGLLLIFIPDTFGNMLGETIKEPPTWRLVGAEMFSVAVISMFAYRQKIWERVKLVAQLNIISSALLVIVTVYGLAFEGVNASDWMNVAIVGAFLVAFSILYYRE